MAKLKRSKLDVIRLSWTYLVKCGLFVAALGIGGVQAAEPVKGGTFNVILHPAPSILVGALTTAQPTVTVAPKIHDGLVTYDFDYNLKPQLATSWAVSPDGKSITFNLRKGVKWHDGQDFTSADVAFSIMLMKKFHPRGRGTFADVEAVDTPDSHTAILRLSRPAPYIMRAFPATESPIVPKHIYEGKDPKTNPNNSAPIGTGPFKFKEWVKGSHITLVRNPDYWDQPKPYLDKVVYHLIPDSAARAVALESGEVDMGSANPVPLSDIGRLTALPHLAGETSPNSYTLIVTRIEFNLENQYFKNKKVRQAVAHAIDKKFIRDNIWFGYAEIATGQVHVDLRPFYTSDVPTYKYDPDQANRLLDEAGFKRGSDGVRFRVTHDYLPIGSTFKRTAEYIKQKLKQVGIEVTIRGQDFPTYVRRIYTQRQFDFTNHMMNNTPDPTSGVQRLYWSKNFKPGVPFSNGSGYSNPEMDRLLEAAKIELDPKKRAELWHAVQRHQLTDLPDIPLSALKRVTLYNKRVKNLFLRPMGHLDNFADVYLEK